MRYKSLVSGVLSAVLLMTASGYSARGSDSLDANPAAHGGTTTVLPKTAPAGTPEAEAATDYMRVYGEVLDGYYNLIAYCSEEYDPREGETGVLEAIRGKGNHEALDSVGYALQDISGDGIPELLIGAVTERENSISYGNEIFAAYSCVENIPRLSFEGIARSSYRFTGEGNFFYQGSNGAMYSIFGTYTISPDGRFLSCNDYYFTYEKDESFQEIGYYHNTSGKWDKSVSKELGLTGDQFWQMASDLEQQIHNVELIPFSQYTLSGGDTGPVGSQVRAQWAKDALYRFSTYDEFVADTTESQVGVLFMTDSSVEGFKVLGLTLDSVDHNGKATFLTKELYGLDVLAPERPLVVRLPFHGAIPHYGISYVDRSGTTRSFALEMSGKDGSLLLSEF